MEIPFSDMMIGREVKLANVPPIDGKTYLDIKDADIATGTWKLQMNSWVGSDMPFAYEGVTYGRGVSLIAPSEINFFLNGQYERLHTTALTGATASVTLQVYVDRKLVYDSGLLEGATSQGIDLPLQGASDLRLIVTDGGNGRTGDSVAWADLWLQSKH